MSNPNSTPPAAMPDPATTAAKIAVDIETIASSLAQVAAKITEPTAITAIEGFATALPALTELALKFWAWADRVSGGNPGTLIANFGTQVSALAAAKTQEDRNAATQGIANLISKLP